MDSDFWGSSKASLQCLFQPIPHVCCSADPYRKLGRPQTVCFDFAHFTRVTGFKKTFPYTPVLNLQFSFNLKKYVMKFIDVLQTLCHKSQYIVCLHLTKVDVGHDVYVTYLHQVDLHDNNWRKRVRQREKGYKVCKSRSHEPSRIY